MATCCTSTQRWASSPASLSLNRTTWCSRPRPSSKWCVSHIYSVILSRWWQSYFSFHIYCLASIFVRLKRRPVEIAWWGIWPSFDCRFFISFWLCSLTFLKVCFPKPADLLVIFLTTSVKRYFIYIWHILLSPPSVKSSFGPIQSLRFVSVSVISSSFLLAAGGTTFSQDCAGCVWNHRPCIRISIKFKIKLYIFHTQQAAIVFETCFPLKRAILVISREEKLVPVCSSCLSPAVGGVTARGQPSAAKGSVVHVSLPGARRSCTLSAFKPHPTAGQEWLLHHYHPTDRFLPPLSLTLTSNHLKQQHVWGGRHHSQLYLLK